MVRGVCLLVLVASAVASAAKLPPPPLLPSSCLSDTLNRTFPDGATWTEPACTKTQCVAGRQIGLPCGLLALGPGCRLETGLKSGEYPSCCPQAVCPGQCYVESLGKVFDDGEEWTGSGCTKARCDKGFVAELPCGLFRPGPGCRLESGLKSGEYPSCCPQAVCPGQCYVESLGKVFDHGEEWTGSGCTKARCDKGFIAELPCGLLRAGPDCVVLDGMAGAEYPTCCPQLACN